jgi:hypothetical protein
MASIARRAIKVSMVAPATPFRKKLKEKGGSLFHSFWWQALLIGQGNGKG